jgi:hypothetical protein
MLKDADGTGSHRVAPANAAQAVLQRKRSDLDQEMVTSRSRSTSGAVIKKLRARPAERRNSVDATDLVVLDAHELDLGLDGLGTTVRSAPHTFTF